MGLAGAPVRVRLRQPPTLQEAVPRLPQERHRLLPGGEARELRDGAGAQALADAHRAAACKGLSGAWWSARKLTVG